MEIITTYDNDRAFWGCAPWIAVYDNYDGAPDGNNDIGFGYTENEAIEDLKDAM